VIKSIRIGRGSRIGLSTLTKRSAIVVYLVLLWALGSGILALALPLNATAIGLSAAQWGLLSGAFAVGLLIAEPTWGWLSDRLGIVKPFLISRFLSAVVTLAFALTTEMWILLVVQAARGAAEVAMGPLGRKALADCLGAEKKAMGIGLFQASLAVGRGVGPLLAAYIIEHRSYAAAFVACSVLSLAGLVITLGSRAKLDTIKNPKPTPNQGRETEDTGGRATAGGGWLAPFSILALVAICLFLGVGVGRSFIPLVGASVAGLGASEISWLLTAAGLGSGILMVVAGRISDRLTRSPFILWGVVLVSISICGYGYAASFWNMALFTVVYSVGIAAATPAAVALISDITPVTRQGQMIGLYGSFEDLGLMVGPMLCGFLWDSQGSRVALLVCGLLTAVGVVPSLLVRRRAAQLGDTAW